MAASSKIANAAWWMVYFAAGLCLQLHCPGVDAFIPGIMLSCQEKRPQQTFWLCFAAILVQEGTGSLAFGNSLLWYGSLLLFFFLGREFFVTGSLFFVMLLAAALGTMHPVLLYALNSLQGLQTDTYRLAEQALAQALLIPPLYAAASLLRKRFSAHEHEI